MVPTQFFQPAPLPAALLPADLNPAAPIPDVPLPAAPLHAVTLPAAQLPAALAPDVAGPLVAATNVPATIAIETLPDHHALPAVNIRLPEVATAMVPQTAELAPNNGQVDVGDGPTAIRRVEVVQLAPLRPGEQITTLEDLCAALIMRLRENSGLYSRFTRSSLVEVVAGTMNNRTQARKLVDEFISLCVRSQVFIPGGKRNSYLCIASNLNLLQKSPQDDDVIMTTAQESVLQRSYFTVLDYLLRLETENDDTEEFDISSLRFRMSPEQRRALSHVDLDHFVEAGIAECSGNKYRLVAALPRHVDELFLDIIFRSK